MTVHELRQFFMSLSRDRARARLVITLLSFGYKHGVPVDADLVFDVRCLPNPHFVPTLRRRTGRDRAVSEFMERDPAAREFMDRLEEYLRYVVPFYIAEGKSYLTVGIGCTGGRHRSVMIAERLRRPLAGLDVARVRVLTDMFGATPSNLGMTFLETDRLEVITGVNLPMLIKLASLRRSSDLLAVAREMRDHGRNAIWVASDLLRGEKSPA